jgi:hypothetical protein
MSCSSIGRWWAWEGGGVAVRVACGAPADRHLLTPAERAQLDARRLAPERCHAWIRGRALARRALGVPDSVLSTRSGAPRVAGGQWRLGFTHDGPWTAVVARADGAAAVAIDVVACDAARALRALARVRVRSCAVDPRAIWSALECGLKLRGWHVTRLLDRRVAVEQTPSGSLLVRGLGARFAVRVARLPGATVSWTDGSPG